jgi:Tfp pilus assembly protein PilN
MRDINLLPREYRKKPASRYLFLIVLLLCLSVWPAVRFGYLLPLEIKTEKAQQLASLQTEADKLPELEESCEAHKTDLEKLQRRVLAFKKMEESSPQYWQGVLRALTESLPAGTSIRDFSCDNHSILLSGISSSDIASAQYLRNLQNSRFFADVRMENIQYTKKEEISFHLRCTLVSGEIEKLETEDAVP